MGRKDQEFSHFFGAVMFVWGAITQNRICGVLWLSLVLCSWIITTRVLGFHVALYAWTLGWVIGTVMLAYLVFLILLPVRKTEP